MYTHNHTHTFVAVYPKKYSNISDFKHKKRSQINDSQQVLLTVSISAYQGHP